MPQTLTVALDEHLGGTMSQVVGAEKHLAWQRDMDSAYAVPHKFMGACVLKCVQDAADMVDACAGEECPVVEQALAGLEDVRCIVQLWQVRHACGRIA